MTATYSVIINDNIGNKLAVPTLNNLRWYRSVNGLGSFSFSVQLDEIPDYFLKRDNIVEIWRIPENGARKLATDTLWFIRKITYSVRGKKRTVSVFGYDLNFILGNSIGSTGKIAAFYANETQTSKTDYADDMIKAIARENFGPGAVDYNAVARDTPFIKIDPDYSLAPSISKAFAWRNLSRVFGEICKASREATNGNYLAYDFVCSIPPHNLHSLSWPTIPTADDDFTIIFKTFIDQRGKDHTREGGDPALFGPVYGNMDNVTLERDYSDEISYAYAGGDGMENTRVIRVADGYTNFTKQPWIWNRREVFIDSVGSGATALQNEANAALRGGKPTVSIAGDILSTPSTQYGLHWEWGDKVSIEFLDYSLDAWIENLTVNYSQENGELITCSVRSEEEL